MSNAQGSDRKTSSDVKVYPKTVIGSTATSPKQQNEKVKRKPGFTSENTRESDESKTASPSGPSETEHSTDTDGDGAEADDENEENEPKKGVIYYLIFYHLLSFISFFSYLLSLLLTWVHGQVCTYTETFDVIKSFLRFQKILWLCWWTPYYH